MRKGLIATAVAVALFAVGAFAASFAVESEDTASGSNAVKPCAENVAVDFTETYVETSKNWNVTTVALTFTAANDRFDACKTKGALVTLVLQDDANNQVYKKTVALNTATEAKVITIPVVAADVIGEDTTLPVGKVWNAAVLIDGAQLSNAPPS
jgi:hypothetical protein